MFDYKNMCMINYVSYWWCLNFRDKYYELLLVDLVKGLCRFMALSFSSRWDSLYLVLFGILLLISIYVFYYWGFYILYF